MGKYRKIIEKIRLFGSVAIGVVMSATGQYIIGLGVLLFLGLLDQMFINSKLKPNIK